MVPDLYKLNFPVETEEAKKFWSSKHKANRMQAIIAFSLDEKNANDNLRRYGYKLGWRKKAIKKFTGKWNKPGMSNTDFTFYELSTPWWEAMPIT